MRAICTRAQARRHPSVSLQRGSTISSAPWGYCDQSMTLSARRPLAFVRRSRLEGHRDVAQVSTSIEASWEQQSIHALHSKFHRGAVLGPRQEKGGESVHSTPFLYTLARRVHSWGGSDRSDCTRPMCSKPGLRSMFSSASPQPRPSSLQRIGFTLRISKRVPNYVDSAVKLVVPISSMMSPTVMNPSWSRSSIAKATLTAKRRAKRSTDNADIADIADIPDPSFWV